MLNSCSSTHCAHEQKARGKVGTVDRCGYGGQLEVTCISVPVNLRHTEASFFFCQVQLICCDYELLRCSARGMCSTELSKL